jgi:hypothetical protein
MRTMRFVCWLALPVGIVLCGLNAAGAQGSVDAREACTPDAMRLCSEFIPDAEKVKTCMLAKRAQLSEACRTAMSGGPKGRKHAARYRRVRKRCRRHSRHCG